MPKKTVGEIPLKPPSFQSKRIVYKFKMIYHETVLSIKICEFV